MYWFYFHLLEWDILCSKEIECWKFSFFHQSKVFLKDCINFVAGWGCFYYSYCQAQVAAKEGLSKLRNLNVSTKRPEDYFAEMVKSDVHMQKVDILLCYF